MKLYPSVSHANTAKLRPVIGFFEPENLDEASNRVPPTSVCRSGGAGLADPAEGPRLRRPGAELAPSLPLRASGPRASRVRALPVAISSADQLAPPPST